MVSFGAFWPCDLLTHLLNLRLSFLSEQLVRSSQQLVLMDTKRVFRPCHFVHFISFLHVLIYHYKTKAMLFGGKPGDTVILNAGGSSIENVSEYKWVILDDHLRFDVQGEYVARRLFDGRKGI